MSARRDGVNPLLSKEYLTQHVPTLNGGIEGRAQPCVKLDGELQRFRAHLLHAMIEARLQNWQHGLQRDGRRAEQPATHHVER